MSEIFIFYSKLKYPPKTSSGVLSFSMVIIKSVHVVAAV